MWQYEHFSETKQGERKMAEFREVLNTTIEMLICPGWEIPVVLVSQLGTPGRDKRGSPFVPGLATGTKGAASATCLAHPFVPVGVTNRDKRVLFVPVARPGIKGHPLLSRPGVPAASRFNQII